jgi:spermidine/putrescine transport system substrate-binding protein
VKKFLFCVVWLCAALPALASDRQVFLFNWSEYMPDAVLEQFKEETGIEVVYTTFDNNESMYAKLKLTGESGYDIAVPSTYYVSRMRAEGLLQQLDKSKLDNLQHIDPNKLNQPFDPNNEYSIPYLWGSTGLSVNAAEVSVDSVQSWADLWRPEYAGQILLIDDVRDVFSMGLHVLGYSANSTDSLEIHSAYEKLKEMVPGVRVFDSDSPKMPYLNGEVNVGMNWNGEVFQAVEEGADMAYIYPTEGAMLWMDNLVIPSGAKHVEDAHTFINFLLRPEIAKMICEDIGYASPNKTAIGLLDEAVRTNRTVYPTDEDLRGSEFQNDVGSAIAIYTKYWELLKAGH